MKLEKQAVIGFRPGKDLLKHLSRDMQRSGLRRSDVIRQILLRHYRNAGSEKAIGL